MMSRLTTRRPGFTLIEMMIVLLVISALLLIAIPSYTTARAKSRENVCRSQLRQLQDAKDRWAIDKRMSSRDIPAMNDLIPVYLKTVPSCPGGGTYTLGEVGENVTCSEGGHKL